ncbi:MAG TPA: hypothetical protein VFP43_23100 [Mesorhizobium sp.]|nr:hypothetical protein [Mesorhizobium sp.]
MLTNCPTESPLKPFDVHARAESINNASAMSPLYLLSVDCDERLCGQGRVPRSIQIMKARSAPITAIAVTD